MSGSLKPLHQFLDRCCDEQPGSRYVIVRVGHHAVIDLFVKDQKAGRVTLAKTPSDGRAWMNGRATIRRLLRAAA